MIERREETELSDHEPLWHDPNYISKKKRSDRGFEDSVAEHIAEVKRRYAFNNSDYLLQIEGSIEFVMVLSTEQKM